MEKTFLSWTDYEELVRKIVAHVEHDHIKPDLIVGIARGGLPLLASTASFFGTRQIGVIFMQKRLTDDVFAERLPKAVCDGVGIPFPIRGRAILLVDDIIRSGQTVAAASNVLLQAGAGVIKVTSIYKESGSYSFSHFSAATVSPDVWIVFPWDNLKGV
jgi:uncharacterized protein